MFTQVLYLLMQVAFQLHLMEGSYHSPIVRILNAITTLYLTLSCNPLVLRYPFMNSNPNLQRVSIFLLNLYDLPVFLKFHSLFRPLGLILNGIISISVSLLRTEMIFKPTITSWIQDLFQDVKMANQSISCFHSKITSFSENKSSIMCSFMVFRYQQ